MYLYRTGPRPGKRTTMYLFMVLRAVLRRLFGTMVGWVTFFYSALPQSGPDKVASAEVLCRTSTTVPQTTVSEDPVDCQERARREVVRSAQARAYDERA